MRAAEYIASTPLWCLANGLAKTVRLFGGSPNLVRPTLRAKGLSLVGDMALM